MLNGSNQIVKRTTAINPFNQSVNTIDSPIFVGQSLTWLSTNNTQTTMLMLNGSNHLIKRTTSINKFD